MFAACLVGYVVFVIALAAIAFNHLRKYPGSCGL
jgi:hypothetical protein